MNTRENNKLIAEFMGYEFDDMSETFDTPFLLMVEEQAFGDEAYSSKLHDYELRFHQDWNWLMEVVDKIESIVWEELNETSFDVTIGATSYCVIQDNNGGVIEIVGNGKTKIESVYNAVVLFIQWYNEQK